YSCIHVSELFLVDPGIPSYVPTTVNVSPQLPVAIPTLIPDIHMCSQLHIYLHAAIHNTVASSSDSNRLLELLDQFFNRLAQKASACPKAQLDMDALLLWLKALPSLGFSSLLNYSDTLRFTGLWFLRGFIPRDLSSLIIFSSGLPRCAASKIILRQFLKLHREIYHQLWRPKCKMKSLKDMALNITPTMLRNALILQISTLILLR
ncbi:hypothetical protein RhiirA4_430182, partial [Rhizophagus irregularis]